jgi:hypothetical protein
LAKEESKDAEQKQVDPLQQHLEMVNLRFGDLIREFNGVVQYLVAVNGALAKENLELKNGGKKKAS